MAPTDWYAGYNTNVITMYIGNCRRHWRRIGFVLFWAFTTGQAAQPPPPQPRACPSQVPTKRGVCASLPAALLPVDATHVAAVPSTPAAISAKPPRRRQTHWRVTSNWPPSPSPLHGATRLLPTPVEQHTSAYQGGSAFAPATPQPPSAAACGTSAPRELDFIAPFPRGGPPAPRNSLAF
jgi:hypothetical protein